MNSNLAVDKGMACEKLKTSKRRREAFGAFVFLLGNVYLVNAKRSTEPLLHRLTMAYVILGYIYIALPLIICGVFLSSLSCMFVAHQLMRNDQHGPDDDIDSCTKEIKFTTGMYAEDDAMCAVCLGDYEGGQNLRILQCRHHFHIQCVDKWLLNHTTCPLCVQKVLGSQKSLNYRSLVN